MNKKNYKQPSVESTLLEIGSAIMVGSPGININNTTPIDNEEND